MSATMCRRLIIAVVALATALSPLAFVSPAAAAEDSVLIRKVDTTDSKEVVLTVLKPSASGAGDEVKVSENGKAISNVRQETVRDANVPIATVLVIDNSSASTHNDALTKMKAAAVEMVLGKGVNEQFAVVATQGVGRTVVSMTSNTDALVSAISGLEPGSENALWNSVRNGAELLAAHPELQSNMVILSTSADKTSSADAFEAARSQLRSVHAVVFTVGFQGKEDLGAGNLQALADNTGGRFLSTNDPGTSTQILAGLSNSIAGQAVLTYSSLGGKELDIVVGVGTGTAEAHVSRGVVVEGASVNPDVVKASTPPFLRGQMGLILVGVVSFLFAGLLIYGIIEIVGRERNQLSAALRPYSEGGFDPEAHNGDFSRIADSEIIRKAVAATARAAERRGLLEIVQKRLEQADLPLKPAEALFFTGLVAVVFMILGGLLFDVLGVGIAGLVFLAAPVIVMSALAKRRRKQFTSQLPDTLQLLAGTLRAGYSLVQGIDAVSKQTSAPMSTELQRAMAEARLGRPVEEALQEVSDRMGSADFEWAVMAIKIQREVGGNLAELLMTVSETMVGRERLRREVKGLTAEGRISAIVLSALPFGLGALITVMNPSYMEPLLSNTLGQLALVVATVMIGFGYWLMNKMIEIEV